MIQDFKDGTLKPKFSSDTGALLPFLCRLSAITGSGKTPVLALAATELKDAIILWTTNRGAVIHQTLANLRPGGKYAELLPIGTQVFSIPEMSDADWMDTVHKTEGLTILLSTVAAFNQEGDKLRIHRDRGDGTTAWTQLAGETENGRERNLYVFYDEAHGTTEKQFRKLLELNPRAFVLASASPVPDDLGELLPGRSLEEQEASLKERTSVVPTKEVVKSGLLKQQLFFIDCNVSQQDAVKEACDQWKLLHGKLRPHRVEPIACYIVNDTSRGVDIWEHLVALGVPKTRIAVHLDGAKDVILNRLGRQSGLIDTYTGKTSSARTPEILRDLGYTHIIWNLTLREGWDEPLAYVAYIDSKGKSQVDITQKIGRFVRQPNGEPFDDPDLNSAYFYFNITDEEFEALLKNTQKELEGEGYELLAFKQGKTPPPSREVPSKTLVVLEKIAPWFGEEISARDKIVIDLVPGFADDYVRAKGVVSKRVIDMKAMAENVSLRTLEEREANESLTVWEYLSARLRAIDDRIVNDRSTIFSPNLRDYPRLRQRVEYGSEAIQPLNRIVDSIISKLNEEFRLVSMGKLSQYEVPPFKLIAPDATGTSEAVREKYKVRQYKNAIHAEYNGMNNFEVQIAAALDSTGKRWCRNPARGGGYAIPIPQIGAGTDSFYPDFLLWNGSEVWALDPKGKHLINEAITRKLLDLRAVSKMKVRLQVAFLVEGRGSISTLGKYVEEGPGGFTLVRRTSAGIKSSHHKTAKEMINALIKG